MDFKRSYTEIYNKFSKKFPIVNGDGSYSRDFTYIENVIYMNYLALTTNNQKALNRVYNTACGEKITILEMAQTIKSEMLKTDLSIKNIEIKFGPKRVGDVPHSKANISKAKKLLNYVPTHFFKEGINETIKWYMSKKKYEI